MSKSSANEKKYLQLVELVRKAYPTLEKRRQYDQAQEIWRTVKNDQQSFENKVRELKAKAAKVQSSMMSFWGKALSPAAKKKREDNVACASALAPAETDLTRETKVVEIGE